MLDHENTDIKSLFASSIREKADSYIVEEIFNQFRTPAELVDVTEQELIQIKGIGIGKARQITALLKLAKVLSAPNRTKATIRSPKDVFDLLEPKFRYLQKEHFVCLFLNTKNDLIFSETISIGSLNSAIVHPREVFRAAVKRCSASLICSHNHPSGDPTPSTEDVSLTRRLIEAGEIMGIELLDHVIIGGNRFYSLKEHGYM